VNAIEVILYVADQQRAASFYRTVLGIAPSLDVPGMTELDLGGATLGLMPASDMAALVPGIDLGAGQRCELYLRRHDAAEILDRVEAAGGRLLSPVAPRPWGERVGYALDPDGHVLALAVV
jgi:predicted enzyme related to lactoylglutathione lyase